ncbi:MAG: CopD family protein [Chloroflexi bacterium]|nr:CopD family protein [Chloroflexota bacterium]
MVAAADAWLHLVASAVWVGSQIFLVLAVVPALRAIQDPAARKAALTVLTRRYGVVGWVSLVVLVLTGLHRASGVIPAMGLLSTTWYGQVLLAKAAMVGAILLLTTLHTAHIGPRLLELMPATAEAPPPEYLRMRRLSLVVSSATLALSLLVLAAAVVLRMAPF